VERLEISYLVNLEPNVGVGVDRSPSSSPQVNHLVVVLFHTVKLNPGNMVFWRVGMTDLMAHNHTNDVLSCLMSLVNLDVGNMFLLSFVLLCFDELSEVHSVLLSILFCL